MKKQLVSMFVILLLSLMGAGSVFGSPPTPTCSDSDGGHGVTQYFTGGHISYSPPSDAVSYDNCFGHEEETENHEKLREYYCDGTDNKKQDIDCQDYGAVCVEDAQNGDHCACPEGTHFDDERCVPNQQEPFCGDGVVNQPSEECDDGPSGSETCTPNCTLILPPHNDVPEFTTIGAGIAVLGAAGFALFRRKRR